MSALDALQTALAAEHAAIYVYGDVGAHTSQSAEPELFATVSLLYRAHRGRRDQLELMVADRGGVPVAAAPTYELPRRLGTPSAVRRHAMGVEQACAEVYAATVASTTGTDRAWAVSALGEAAVARILLGGESEDFPGAPELGD
ncbi:ferritin-like domain-containing protein [Nocardioides currus]|uniref:DUF4439 domain-containing protein n=1 Tax=Nocardioides currus TaxID=2133958 RepID=A0A2R7YW97_9ACTN|nr:ferritin-like domain-containing protein [Nocardioides currus]PUA80687.1 DUF4439 domain-containing protein [Nocardioides currus]